MHSFNSCLDKQTLSRSTYDAFTLIEILVVIGIIAVLAALIVPNISSALKKARLVESMSSHRQLSIGIISWTADHDGRFPNSSDYYNWAPGQDMSWAVPHLFHDYLGKATESDYNKILFNPAVKYNTSYPNYWNGYPDANGWMKVDHLLGKKLAAVSSPSKTILTFELAMMLGISFHDPAASGPLERTINGIPYYRKSGNKVVVSFVDGHVAYIPTYVNMGDSTSPPTGYNPPADWPVQYQWNP